MGCMYEGLVSILSQTISPFVPLIDQWQTIDVKKTNSLLFQVLVVAFPLKKKVLVVAS